MTWDIFAHEWAADLLRRHIATGEARHAYLFTGPPGVGRRTLALRFAQALNCINPPAPGEFCGECRLCKQIARGQQPDLAIVVPAEDTTTLKVDQIRDLQHSLSLAPYEARLRVALLPNFDQATISAQNALLKTLEEAPEKAVLLLTADSAENLLPTITSRCEILRLRPAPFTALAEALHQRWGVPAEEARVLAHLSAGRPGYALRLKQTPALLAQHEGWLVELGELVKLPARERLVWLEKHYRRPEREAMRQVFIAWLTYWRDVLLAAAGSKAPFTNLEHASEIAWLAGQVGLPAARAAAANLEAALERLDANANTRLLLDITVLDWPQV